MSETQKKPGRKPRDPAEGAKTNIPVPTYMRRREELTQWCEERNMPVARFIKFLVKKETGIDL